MKKKIITDNKFNGTVGLVDLWVNSNPVFTKFGFKRYVFWVMWSFVVKRKKKTPQGFQAF